MALVNDEKKNNSKILILSSKNLYNWTKCFGSDQSIYKHLTKRRFSWNSRGNSWCNKWRRSKPKRNSRRLCDYASPRVYYPSLLCRKSNWEKKWQLTNGKKSFDGGNLTTKISIKELVQLRQEKAQLLGYPIFADYVLEERMAKSHKKKSVRIFERIIDSAKPFAQKMWRTYRFSKSWWNYRNAKLWPRLLCRKKLRKQKFDFNDEELKPYFS